MDAPTLSQASADGMLQDYKASVQSQLLALDWLQVDIDLVLLAIDSYPIDPLPIENEITNIENTAPDKLEETAQIIVNDNAIEAMPVKDGAVNGVIADPAKEPINTSKVSNPKNIPVNHNSFEEEHPDAFGYKDRAGNWEKHNLLTSLYQRGLANGYIFRSDSNGNTTVFIPANHKVRIGESYNVNSGAFDHFMSGEGHFESSKKLTIKAPNIELIGALQVTGTQNNSSTIDAVAGITSGAVVVGLVNGVFGGKSFLSHTHSGDSGGTTSPPK